MISIFENVIKIILFKAVERRNKELQINKSDVSCSENIGSSEIRQSFGRLHMFYERKLYLPNLAKLELIRRNKGEPVVRIYLDL